MSTPSTVIGKNNLTSLHNLEVNTVKEQKCKSPFKVYAFGLSCIQVTFQFTLSLTKLNNFFEYLMRGKFNDSVPPEHYNSIQSNLNALFLAGAFACSVTSGRILDKFSPRSLFTLSMILIILLNIVETVSSLWGMYLARFCIGYLIVFNLFVGPLMVSHCCPSEFVGFLGSFFGFFTALGMFVASLIKSEVSGKYWYVFLNLPTVFEALRLVLIRVFFFYESPYFVFNRLVLDQKRRFLKDSLDSHSTSVHFVYDRDELQRSFCKHKEVKKLVNALYHKRDSQAQKEYLFTVIEKYHRDRCKLDGVWKTAFSKEYRRQFFVGVVINFAGQMTGISVIVLYSKNLYQLLDFGDPELLVSAGGSSNQESCISQAASCQCSWSGDWAANC